MNEHPAANVFALLERPNNEIRRVFDRCELRCQIRRDPVLVSHNLMDREILPYCLEHFAVEVGNAIFAAQSDSGAQLARHVVIVILHEAVEISVAERLRVLPECWRCSTVPPNLGGGGETPFST